MSSDATGYLLQRHIFVSGLLEESVRRISIVRMMWYVSFTAIGLAALRNADGFWCGTMLWVTFGMLGISILGVIHHRGQERAWWLGFGIFETIYLTLALSAWFPSVESSLGTSQLFRYLYRNTTNVPVEQHAWMLARTERHYLDTISQLRSLDSTNQFGQAMAKALESQLVRTRDTLIELGSPMVRGMTPSIEDAQQGNLVKRWLPAAANHETFARIGHCISALIAGLIGAAISSRLHRQSRVTSV